MFTTRLHLAIGLKMSEVRPVSFLCAFKMYTRTTLPLRFTILTTCRKLRDGQSRLKIRRRNDTNFAKLVKTSDYSDFSVMGCDKL